MLSNRKRWAWDRQPPVADAALRDSVLRATAKDRRTFGYVLARLREERRLTPGEQAAALGVNVSALVFLSVFRLPRAAHRETDLVAASTAIGIGAETLRGLLQTGPASGDTATAPIGGVA